MTTTTRHEAEVDTRIAAALVAVRKAVRNVECRKTSRRPRQDEIDAAEEALVEAQAALDAVTPLYGGWSRFTVVPGGHIHTWDGCHTIRITTDVRWLPELSGLTEADAVEAHGEILCSHCFPSAPVAWTNGVSKQSIADKALKAIAKTPEGKAVIKAERDLWFAKDTVLNLAREVEWSRGMAEQAAAPGAEAYLAQHLDQHLAAVETAQARLPKAEKAVAKAQAKLDAANAALDAALAS